MVLTLLAAIVAALVGLAVAAIAAPRRMASPLAAAIAALSAVAAVILLVAPATNDAMALPFGMPFHGMYLVLDPLGRCFLLLVNVAGIPCALFGIGRTVQPRPLGAGMPLALAGLLLSVLAGDAATLAAGLALAGLAGWLIDPADGHRHLRSLAIALVCLIGGLALAASPTGGAPQAGFAAIRAAPPQGWVAAAVLALIAVATLAIAWRHAVAPGPGNAGALLAAGAPLVAVYLLVRVVVDLCGPAQPAWWGFALAASGAAIALCGALRASLAAELDRALGFAGLHAIGLSLAAIGVALAARAVDLPALTAMALDAAWLLLVGHALSRSLLHMAAVAAQDGAGTRHLDRMGGLIHPMRTSSLCLLAGLAGSVALPTSLGFAGFWLLFQSLVAIARSLGLAPGLLFAGILGIAGLSSGLLTLAAIRLFGVAFLGRPRTPRAAAAEEAPNAARLTLVGWALAGGVAGVLPGLVLFAARPALALLANDVDAPGFPLPITLGVEASGYIAPAVALLLLAAMIAALRLRGQPQARREAAWSDGFAPPPPWLPFGDPATQLNAAAFTDPLRRFLDTARAAMAAHLRPPPGASAAGETATRLGGLRQPMAALHEGRHGVACVLAALALVLALWLAAT